MNVCYLVVSLRSFVGSFVGWLICLLSLCSFGCFRVPVGFRYALDCYYYFYCNATAAAATTTTTTTTATTTTKITLVLQILH